MTGFPAAEFHLTGDPTTINASAGRWTAFGTAATDAAAQIRSLDSSLFVGPEADQYRQRLNHDLPPHLDTTGRAYTAVGTTLTGFARALSTLQDRMAPLRGRAPALWAALQQAEHRLSAAQSADHQHKLHSDADARSATGRAPDTDESDLGPATTSLSHAQRAWNECLTAARAVHADLRAAVDTSDRAIRDAADLRFTHNPHGVHALVSGFTNFVTDHAKGLSQLSGALKIVSGIAGVLSFIPVVGAVALAVSLVTGGAALLIDASLKYATGKGSWTSIAIDGALLALPFGIGKAITALHGARATLPIAYAAERGSLARAAATEAGSALPGIVVTEPAALGSKLEYLLGNATGNAHNIERSVTMERQLQRIGIYDNTAGRSLLEDHLRTVLADPSSAVGAQENGRVLRDGLLAGPGGFLKTQSIWQNNKLITVTLFGGK